MALSTSALSALIDRATRAQPRVRELTLEHRLSLLGDARRRLARERDLIIDSAVDEVGTPRRFARREVDSALAVLDAMPELAEQIRPRVVPARSGVTDLEWVPYGVVLGWHAANSPVWVPTLVISSALAGGNAVLSRPSARARRTSAIVLDALAASFPVDAVVPVNLSGPEAEPLVWADGVDAVVAHAGTETCKRHLECLGRAYGAGTQLRPYIPEGAGNDAALVLEGADLEHAARAIVLAGFANGGQLCMAAKRIIVQRPLWRRFEPLLREAVSELVVGPPGDETTDVAPLRAGRARDRACAALREALEHGGRLVVGEGEQDEYFFPTIVELKPDHLDLELWREESFAPLRGLVVAEDVDHAVYLANDTRFGLGVAIFGASEDLVDRLRVARVMIDESPLYQDPHVVVGGVRDSGMSGARPKIEQLVYARRVHRARVG